jgi:hypothetical protein
MSPAIGSRSGGFSLGELVFGQADVGCTCDAGGAGWTADWNRLLGEQRTGQQSRGKQHRRLLWDLLDTVQEALV